MTAQRITQAQRSMAEHRPVRIKVETLCHGPRRTWGRCQKWHSKFFRVPDQISFYECASVKSQVRSLAPPSGIRYIRLHKEQGDEGSKKGPGRSSRKTPSEFSFTRITVVDLIDEKGTGIHFSRWHMCKFELDSGGCCRVSCYVKNARLTMQVGNKQLLHGSILSMSMVWQFMAGTV